jgi:hypothetical protein
MHGGDVDAHKFSGHPLRQNFTTLVEDRMRGRAA